MTRAMDSHYPGTPIGHSIKDYGRSRTITVPVCHPERSEEPALSLSKGSRSDAFSRSGLGRLVAVGHFTGVGQDEDNQLESYQGR